MARQPEGERKLKVAVVSIWSDEKLHDEVTAHLQKDKDLQVTKFSFEKPEDSFELMNPKISKMNEIGKTLLQIKQKHDLLIVLGLGHTGLKIHSYALGHQTAIPIYHLPGQVARLDKHQDEGTTNETVNNVNYVTHVVKEGLKQPEEITNYGTTEYSFDKVRTKNPSELPHTNAKIFDVDIDAFHRKYKMKKGYWPGVSDVLISQFGKAVINAKPHTIGFFEYGPHRDYHGLGLRTIKSLSLLAAQALKNKERLTKN